MKITYNPLYKADGTTKVGALSSAPTNDIIFDLPGVAIWARKTKFLGTDANVLQSLTTTNKWRPITLGYQYATKGHTDLYKTVTAQIYTTNILLYLPSTGTLQTTILSSTGNTVVGGDIKMTAGGSAIHWNDGTYHLRILTTDDSTKNTAVFTFQQSEDTAKTWNNLFTIYDNKYVESAGFIKTGSSDSYLLQGGGGHIAKTTTIGPSSGTNAAVDTKIPTEKAVRDAITAGFGVNDAMAYKGTYTGTTSSSTVDLTKFSTLPGTNSTGWTWKVSTAGYFGNLPVEVGDMIIACVDNPGNTVTNYNIIQYNIDINNDVLRRYAWWQSSATHDANTLQGGTTFAYSTHNGVSSNAATTGTIVSFDCSTNNNYTLQILGLYNGENLYFRNRNGDTGNWNAWRTIIHSGNYKSFVDDLYWANISIQLSSSTTTTPLFGQIGVGGAITAGYAANVAGNILTSGTIYRNYTKSADTPLIWMNGSDYDNYLFQISSGTSTKQYYGYGLKYVGTGSGAANYLLLIADNLNNTDIVAIGINQNGQVGIGTDASTSYRLDINGNIRIASILYAKTTNMTGAILQVIDEGNNYGLKIVLCGGGTTLIGAGESAQSYASSVTNENLYLMADGNIYFHTNCDTIGNKKTLYINTSGYLFGSYFNTNISNEDTMSPTHIYCSNDTYIRRMSFSKFKEKLNSADITSMTKLFAANTITTNWSDVGIKGGDLLTGSYIIEITVTDSAGTTTSVNNTWYYRASGVMSWYKDNTNDTEADEIILHRAGHAYHNVLYLRTLLTTSGNGGMKLLICSNNTLATAMYVTFKFKKIF